MASPRGPPEVSLPLQSAAAVSTNSDLVATADSSVPFVVEDAHGTTSSAEQCSQAPQRRRLTAVISPRQPRMLSSSPPVIEHPISSPPARARRISAGERDVKSLLAPPALERGCSDSSALQENVSARRPSTSTVTTIDTSISKSARRNSGSSSATAQDRERNVRLRDSSDSSFDGSMSVSSEAASAVSVASASPLVRRPPKPHSPGAGRVRRWSGTFSKASFLGSSDDSASSATKPKKLSKSARRELERLGGLGLQAENATARAAVAAAAHSPGAKRVPKLTKSAQKEMERLQMLGLTAQYTGLATQTSIFAEPNSGTPCPHCSEAVVSAKDRVVLRGEEWHKACWKLHSESLRRSMKSKLPPRLLTPAHNDKEAQGSQAARTRATSLGAMLLHSSARPRRGSDVPGLETTVVHRDVDDAALDTIRETLEFATRSPRLLRLHTTNSSTAAPQRQSPIKTKGVFGRDLQDLLVEESRGVMVPCFVEKAVEFLLQESVAVTEGLFRVSPNQATVDARALKIDQHASSACEFDEDNPHLVAALLKKFLRELPRPLFTFELYPCFIAVAEIDDVPEQLSLLRQVVALLPDHNAFLMNYLFEMIAAVADHSDVNFMDISNLSVCLSPSLLREVAFSVENMHEAQTVIDIVTTMISNRQALGLPSEVV